MQLIIEGAPSGDGITVELIRDASVFMLTLLMAEDPARYESIKVEIDVVDNLLEEYGRAAECNYIDDRLRPSAFYIDIDGTQAYRPFLIALAHELVHIMQMAFGHRQESLDGRGMRWMGKLIYPGDLDYYDLPWEIDALGREFGLYYRFDKHMQAHLAEEADIQIAA